MEGISALMIKGGTLVTHERWDGGDRMDTLRKRETWCSFASNTRTMSTEENVQYWLYHNWQAQEAGRPMLHKSSCGHCKVGSGHIYPTKTSGKNGVWIGPFDKKNLAEKYAEYQLQGSVPVGCDICHP